VLIVDNNAVHVGKSDRILGRLKMGSDATFGEPTFSSEAGITIDLSDDNKAFTVAFSDSSGLAVRLDQGTAPIITRVCSFALPLSGAAPGLEIPFNLQGFVFTETGANGHLLFSVNDQTMVVDFPENSNDSFLKQFSYKVGNPSELRITVFLLADRDSTSNGGVNLSVASIDTDVLIPSTQSGARSAGGRSTRSDGRAGELKKS
jgi:hypothetical protein